MKKLLSWKSGEFKAFSNIQPENVIAVRNEVVNDGLIYLKHIKPIFTESMSKVITFFETYDENNDSLDKFQANIGPNEKMIKDFKNLFDANNMILE